MVIYKSCAKLKGIKWAKGALSEQFEGVTRLTLLFQKYSESEVKKKNHSGSNISESLLVQYPQHLPTSTDN